MKASKILNWAVAGLLLIASTNGLKIDEKDDQEIVESPFRDGSMRSKRPFCNAFTGCGKKRSYNNNALESKEDLQKIQVPIDIYKAMIRDLSEDIRNTIEHEIDEQNTKYIDQEYLPYSTRTMPIRKRYQN
ncbi:hypothetical protein HCN44_004552 [Aphidius gifuensis]|uniref:Cardioactive peptide n=1 Tax=Aphidius gifuensis TaxID=684658 RepID=A0A834XZR8_APHGI|nr:uncharacterized protein LOC122848873 [Aphidius gifuensis]KAF7995080.1 hypothetical protein HCN44_004552 [Aphidius gifuensis]